ncbi:hypothetical protein IG631_22633 [Alternaria alternata]|nr:hypothetical protein IG631_22633 [Alternaria alternata]
MPDPVSCLLSDVDPTALRLFGHSLARQSLLLPGSYHPSQAAVSLVRLHDIMALSSWLAPVPCIDPPAGQKFPGRASIAIPRYLLF